MKIKKNTEKREEKRFIGFTLGVSDYDKLCLLAHKNNRSVSNMLRVIVREYTLIRLGERTIEGEQ